MLTWHINLITGKVDQLLKTTEDIRYKAIFNCNILKSARLNKEKRCWEMVNSANQEYCNNYSIPDELWEQALIHWTVKQLDNVH